MKNNIVLLTITIAVGLQTTMAFGQRADTKSCDHGSNEEQTFIDDLCAGIAQDKQTSEIKALCSDSF